MNMISSLVVFLCLLWLSNGVSSDGVKTDDTYAPDITPPKVKRDYPACTDISRQKCLTVCSVSSVTDADLSWYNGSVLYSRLKITDFNIKLYLEVEHHDKNNYSCVASNSHTNQTTHLNIKQLCKQCPAKTSTIMPVNKGNSVTLPTNLTEVQYTDHIMWFYRDTLIAELYENIKTYHDCKDGRFHNRLQLDNQTGSLTITNISKMIHSGLYNLIIQGSHEECLSYNVTVYDPLPVPVITNNSTQCPTLSNKCVVMCSVNVSHVTLSWYNGSRLHSSISVSDLQRNNFQCLEVKYQDTNTYSCVVNNSFTSKTKQLNLTELCTESSYLVHIIIGCCVAVAGIAFAIVIVIVKYCWTRRASHEGTSEEVTSDNRACEGTRLIPLPSSEGSMPSNCCK